MKPVHKSTKPETSKAPKTQFNNANNIQPKTSNTKKHVNKSTLIPVAAKKQQTTLKPLEKYEEKESNVNKELQIKVQEVKQIVPKKEEQKFVLKPINFMTKVFQELKQKKKQTEEKQIPVGTVYQGYKTIPIQQLEPKVSHKKEYIDGGKQIWENAKNKLYCYKQSCPLSQKSKNGFFETLYEAYMKHGDLKITPDDVWLTIMLFFSKYVNKHAEKLRNAFVTHEGQKKLVVITQSTDETDWTEFFPKMIQQIRKNTVEDVTSHLECKFSSTDQFATVMSTAIIMNTFNKYFKYQRWGAGCGIVNIHMAGNLQDWQQLEEKLYYLRQFDVNGELKKYVDRLAPVLEQFTQTYKGNAHLQFWNNIYHERKDPYSMEYDLSAHINGWLIRFFTTQQELDEQDDAKAGKINVPIHYINLITREQKDFNLVGGCQGVSIEDEKVYRPHFSYAIVEEKIVERKEEKTKLMAPKKVQQAPKSKPTVVSKPAPKKR